MATKAFTAPLIRHVTSRSYAQAAPFYTKDIKATSAVLPNKTLVAALDNGSPVARVTVAFTAGSRYEPRTDLGVSHILRSAAGLTTKTSASFITTRKLAQLGATVTCSGDREFIYYTLESTQDNLTPAVDVLISLVNNQEFRPWELDDNQPRLKFDIAALSPQVRAVDLLHKAAFRRTLGNSLFISPKRIGNMSTETLQHYACNTLTSNRCVVVVVGDTQDRACLVAQSLVLPQSTAQTEKSTYYGGEARKETGGDLAHVALSLQGAPAGSTQSLALAVAAKALGCGPVTKWGSDNSPLAKAIGNIGPFAAAGFNVSYSDNGLLGAVLSVPKDEAEPAVKAVARVLRNPQLNSKLVLAGKNQLKLQVLSEAEDGETISESLAAQAFYTGKVNLPADIAVAIDKITESDVAAALSSATQSKFSMGAVGNLAFVPYVDEL